MSRFNLGIVFIFLYCIVFASAQVATGHYEQTISPYTLALYIFIITTLFYVCSTFRRFKRIREIASKNIATIVKINFSTALSWLTVIYALKYIAPAAVNAMNFATLAVATMIVSYMNKQVVNPRKSDFFLSSILFVLIVVLCTHITETSRLPVGDLIFSITLSVIAGIAAAYNLVYSKILQNNQLSASQVLSVRFFLTLAASLIIVLAMEEPLLPTTDQIGPILLIAFASVVIPIYLLQKGIGYSNAICVGLLSPFLPTLTFFIELLDPRIHFSSTLLLIILLITATILSATILKVKQQK